MWTLRCLCKKRTNSTQTAQNTHLMKRRKSSNKTELLKILLLWTINPREYYSPVLLNLVQILTNKINQQNLYWVFSVHCNHCSNHFSDIIRDDPVFFLWGCQPYILPFFPKTQNLVGEGYPYILNW